jgi:hypothetical protein
VTAPGTTVLEGKTMSSTDSLEGILDLGYAFRGAKALLSAVELGVFTALADEPLDGEALRRLLGLAERGARDFFDALVALGLLCRDGAGRYANSPTADLHLDAHKEGYVGGLFENLNAREYPLWANLTGALRTGRPQTGLEGPSHFGPLFADPQRLAFFVNAMTGASLAPARALAAQFPWDRCKTFVDIGTARGCVPVQVALAHPHLTGAGFDLPVLAPMFDEYVKQRNLSGRVRFVPGDFFVDPLPAADVLIMGRVLHNWDLDRKRMLLQKAHAALPSGGALIVYERLIDDARSAGSTGLLSSLNMLILTEGGFDFTASNCIDWMRDAGFREMRTEPLTDAHSMIVAIK